MQEGQAERVVERQLNGGVPRVCFCSTDESEKARCSFAGRQIDSDNCGACQSVAELGCERGDSLVELFNESFLLAVNILSKAGQGDCTG